MTKQIRLIAYDRHDYLNEVVSGIVRMRRLEEYDIVASIDQRPDGTYNQQVVDLCARLTPDVRLRERCDCNRHVRVNLTEAADEAEETLYLEDDVVPAPDCLEFCQAVMGAVRAHDRIKVVTLLGQNHGDVHVAYRNWHGFVASRWFNAWGNYWISGRLREVLSLWRNEWDDSDALPWDSRITGQVVLDQEWLSLKPLLSRVKNIGRQGRFIHDETEFARRQTNFWSADDFSKPIRAGWR